MQLVEANMTMAAASANKVSINSSVERAPELSLNNEELAVQATGGSQVDTEATMKQGRWPACSKRHTTSVAGRYEW